MQVCNMCVIHDKQAACESEMLPVTSLVGDYGSVDFNGLSFNSNST